MSWWGLFTPPPAGEGTSSAPAATEGGARSRLSRMRPLLSAVLAVGMLYTSAELFSPRLGLATQSPHQHAYRLQVAEADFKTQVRGRGEQTPPEGAHRGGRDCVYIRPSAQVAGLQVW
jgi:hypothetical protein